MLLEIVRLLKIVTKGKEKSVYNNVKKVGVALLPG
jgi:hypothetical protein